jgi:hypothetical protein
MRVRSPLVLLVGLAGPLGAQRPPGAPVKTTCLPHVRVTSGGTRINLPDSTGAIWLPPGTVAQPLGANPHARHLILEDSTVLDVWTTSLPAAGVATTGGAEADSITYCASPIGGYLATVTRATLKSPNRPSVFLGMLNIALDNEHAVNLAATTATAASRDGILSLIAGSLDLRPGRH